MGARDNQGGNKPPAGPADEAALLARIDAVLGLAKQMAQLPEAQFEAFQAWFEDEETT